MGPSTWALNPNPRDPDLRSRSVWSRSTARSSDPDQVRVRQTGLRRSSKIRIGSGSRTRVERPNLYNQRNWSMFQFLTHVQSRAVILEMQQYVVYDLFTLSSKSHTFNRYCTIMAVYVLDIMNLNLRIIKKNSIIVSYNKRPGHEDDYNS